MALGCNTLGHIDGAQAREIVFTALDRGVTLFDTAASYAGGCSEEELGRWLPPDPKSSRIITKFGHPSLANAGTGAASAALADIVLDQSLRRLRREQIDIWLIHFPDEATPLAETLGVIDRAMRAGKVGGYGVSNHAPSQLRALLATAASMAVAGPMLVQAEYNLLERAVEEKMLPMIALEKGMAFAPFFPLAGGLLTGKYTAELPVAGSLRSKAVNRFEQRFFTARNWARLERLKMLCAEHDVSLPHLALQWLASRPGVTLPIVGASSASQVNENCDMMAVPLAEQLLRAASAIVSSAE
ncbi:aldo/keto reductase [Sphingobium sp. EM0848]|uniref:aldo/keto reductase n=1 Tax=Sphingobium sp. EM0848 TaxID=2743473 RepID=UPI00159C94E9|nr:aldo/keto reductase [Sphingobium sp. EM0848]